MCELRGGKEEQTPGASVSGLRPWRQGLLALTEVATNADVQTPLEHARALAHSRREGEEEEDRDEVGSISGKPMNSGRSCHCFSAFSDQEVFMCADQNHVEVI